MSKLFFFDIDGTLIDCNKGLYGISTVNRNSFDQLKQKGHDVFLWHNKLCGRFQRERGI